MIVAIRTFGWTALAGLAFTWLITKAWAGEGGPAMRTWRVGLVQFDAVPEQPERNLKAMERLARQAVGQGARLVMFHEGTLTDYTPKLSELAEREHFEIAHARTGLTEYLDFAIVREDCHYPKPSPEPYLTAIKRHGLQPQECVVIEDSERGLVAAVAAGLECLIVPSEWSKDGDFRRASKVLESIRDVPQEVLRRALDWG